MPTLSYYLPIAYELIVVIRNACCNRTVCPHCRLGCFSNVSGKHLPWAFCTWSSSHPECAPSRNPLGIFTSFKSSFRFFFESVNFPEFSLEGVSFPDSPFKSTTPSLPSRHFLRHVMCILLSSAYHHLIYITRVLPDPHPWVYKPWEGKDCGAFVPFASFVFFCCIFGAWNTVQHMQGTS